MQKATSSLQSPYLAGCKYLKAGHLVSAAQPLVELVHSAVDGLLHRRVVTEDQDAGLDRHRLLGEEENYDGKCISRPDFSPIFAFSC